MEEINMNDAELKNNAKRLAYTLYCVSDDDDLIDFLAHKLNYVPKQLKKDMFDIWIYLKEIK